MLDKKRNLIVTGLIILALLGLAQFGLYKFGRLYTELKKSRMEVENLENKIRAMEANDKKLTMLTGSDRELLKKYSKIYFLNENYVPNSLSDIPAKYLFKDVKNFQIHTNVLPYLKDLLESSLEERMELRVTSAYRSFGTQAKLKAEYVHIYGAGTANQFSADQGYSEHQLGTTLDFTTVKLNGALDGFERTPEYGWLLANAYNYGFVISYPAGNSYYKFEPWHFRFVGIELATRLRTEGKNFYELSQTEIDKYLPKIFD